MTPSSDTDTPSKVDSDPEESIPEPGRWLQRNDSRLEVVVEQLEARQGVPRHPGTRPGLQVLVLTILSQNTTDPNALKAYENLLERFPPEEPGAVNPEELPRDENGRIDTVEIRMSQAADALPSPNWGEVHRAEPSVIEECISVCGLQSSKAATILRALDWLKDRCGAYKLEPVIEGLEPADAAAELSKIKGVGVKTAAVTLMEADQVDVCPVDTHVHRVCQRLRLVPPSSSRDKTFRELQPLLPEGKGYSFHHNLLTFGRSVCTARNPDCENCFLSKICHYYRVETNGEDRVLTFAE